MKPSPIALILAAGKGTRMKSALPKALQLLGGKPMVQSLIDAAKRAGCGKVYVVAGFGYEAVRAKLPKEVTVIHQKEQLGSGHAVMVAEPHLKKEKGPLLLLYCDTPLIQSDTLKALIRQRQSAKAEAALLTADFCNPTGYGRVIRGDGDFVEKIVEENDANEEEKRITEVNVGCYVFDVKKLFQSLKLVKQNPKKKEYYLTDAVGIMTQSGTVTALKSTDPDESLGVNNRLELADAEKALQKRVLRRFMESGVGVRDPQTTFVDSDVEIGQDTLLLPGTVIEEGSRIGQRCVIGPYARIRGGTVIGDEVVIGNFVEVVRSRIGNRTQVKHLTYLGDAEIGCSVNIGAGTITANYDGKNKHRTVVKDQARIGSGTVFVAPVTVGKSAVTGAGAVVTRNTKIQDGQVYIGVPARLMMQSAEKSGQRKGKR